MASTTTKTTHPPPSPTRFIATTLTTALPHTRADNLIRVPTHAPITSPTASLLSSSTSSTVLPTAQPATRALWDACRAWRSPPSGPGGDTTDLRGHLLSEGRDWWGGLGGEAGLGVDGKRRSKTEAESRTAGVLVWLAERGGWVEGDDVRVLSRSEERGARGMEMKIERSEEDFLVMLPAAPTTYIPPASHTPQPSSLHHALDLRRLPIAHPSPSTPTPIPTPTNPAPRHTHAWFILNTTTSSIAVNNLIIPPSKLAGPLPDFAVISLEPVGDGADGGVAFWYGDVAGVAYRPPVVEKKPGTIGGMRVYGATKEESMEVGTEYVNLAAEMVRGERRGEYSVRGVADGRCRDRSAWFGAEGERERDGDGNKEVEEWVERF
ncbi:MAG: hypothetical protein M1833_003389 [Piccolia ochrophora]|nr:MAG: hypothetical protein M1833_003389 [Piccolia ochrophora]